MNSQDRHRQQQERGLRPRLQRCNAVKNIDYHVPGLRASLSSGAAAASEEPQNLRVTRALDLCPVTYAQQKSFRIDGSVDGEVEIICDILGLEGPEGFGISLLEWEKRKVRPSSELLLRSRLLQPESWTDEAPTLASNSTTTKTILTSAEEHVNQKDMEKKDLLLFDDLNNSEITSEVKPFKNPCATSRPGREGDGGIRGTRPPILLPPRPRTIFSPSMPTMVCSPSTLKPPPSMSLPVTDTVSSTWDLIKSFAPEASELEMPTEFEDEGGLVVDAVSEAELKELWLGNIPEDFTGISSFSTMNDDDSSSTTTETFVSPNGRLKRKIRVWMLGVHLGSGSYGTVYEGMSEEGFFFAVKEVSLLDQGSNAEQCIHQLEQEIALLSQFEHENIVQYYGTDKKDSKLYIFLELVTQGSLASLYQKYRLQESQVSAYTRQILNGLNYLHERNVVHRDIKCANILVHVNGSVKLADFGLAKEITKFDMLKSCKGSVYWMAPEVVNPKKTYGSAADIWSLGCTVLEMLTRQIPYPNVEWAQALYNIGRGEQPPIPEYLSRSARDFIKRCVKVNPNDRPTACQLLKHPFVKSSLKASSGSNLNSFNNNKR